MSIKRPQLVSATAIAAVIVATLLLVQPMFGGFGGMFSGPNYHQRVPGYVTQFAKSVERESRCSIFFPQSAWTSYLAYSWYRGGTTDFNALFRCTILRPNALPSNVGEEWARLLVSGIEAGVPPDQMASVMGALGITDVVIAADYDWSFYGTGATTDLLDRYFNSQSVFVRRSFGQWDDYRLRTQDTVARLRSPPSVVWTPQVATLLGPSASAQLHALSMVMDGGGVLIDSSDMSLFRESNAAILPVRTGCERTCLTLSSPISAGGHGPPLPAAWRSLPLARPSQRGVPCHAVTPVLVRGPSPAVSVAPLVGESPPGLVIRSAGVLGDCIVQSDLPVTRSWVQVRFSYRRLAGGPAQLAVGPDGTHVLGFEALPSGSKWASADLVVKDPYVGRPLQAFLYSQSDGAQAGIVEYKGVTIEELAGPIEGTLDDQFAVIPPKLRPPGTGGAEWDGNALRVRVSGSRLVAGTTSFDSGWVLRVRSTRLGQPVGRARHIVVNGYMNGWVLSGQGVYSVALEYMPRRQIEAGIVLAVVGMVLTILLPFRGRALVQRLRPARHDRLPH